MLHDIFIIIIIVTLFWIGNILVLGGGNVLRLKLAGVTVITGGVVVDSSLNNFHSLSLDSRSFTLIIAQTMP